MSSFKINHKSVIIAALTAFVVSAVWYMLFGNALLQLQGEEATAASQEMPAGLIIGEFLRSLVLAYVLAYIAGALKITEYKNALFFSILMWIGFPVILFAGSVLHEGINWKIASIHAGDWLVKPLVIILVITFFHRKQIIKNEQLKNSNAAS